MLLLAGDIGGTKTDLAIFSSEQGPRSPLRQREFASQSYAGLEVMVSEFLSDGSEHIDQACFDVAGPVIDGAARVTNLPWRLDEATLSRDLGLPVRLLNDLEATARAVPLLQPADLHTLNAGDPKRNGAIAVLAPGTGLGEAFLIWDGDHYGAHASEGGHADFAPTDELQSDLLTYLRALYDHVSFERVCSGIGLPHIYEFLRLRDGASVLPSVAAAPDEADKTHAIIDAALKGEPADALCKAALDVFVSVMAGESGNLALKVMSTAGVYLAGGIPMHILPALQSGFMGAFVHKGRFSDLLAAMPVHVVLSQVALIGAASFGMEAYRTT